ncbi:MAG: hypothetical protein WD045_17390 [Pirellulaceae bacterium]
MNLIGKVITVLIFIMSLVFMAMAVSVYATHKNWRDVVKGPDGQSGLEAQIRQLRTEEDQLNDRVNKLNTQLTHERVARRFALAALQARSKAQEAELARLETANAELVKSEADMKIALQLTEANAKKLKEEVDQLWADIKVAQADRDKQFTEVVQMTDRLQQLRVEGERLKEREIQLVDMTARMKRVLTAFGKDEYTPVDGVAPALDGLVTSINDRDLVEVSLGSDDGIIAGNTMDVFRGDTYLGRIRILRTEPNRAVGQVLQEFRRGLIREGDYVSTKL